MSEDDLQKRIEFLIQQAAAADVRMGKIEDALGQVTDVVTRLAQVVHTGFTQIQEQIASTQRQLNGLAEAQARTDEKMNILIDVVEQYFQRRNNGH